MYMDCCQNLKTPTHTTPNTRIRRGLFPCDHKADRSPVPSALPGGWQRQGSSLTRVYDPGTRNGLPGTRVGFSPGALLRWHLSPLGIQAGKLLKPRMIILY